MSLKPLKQINRATRPVNTLSVRRHDAHNGPDAPKSKRQKKDIVRTHDTTTSPHFPKVITSRSSDIQGPPVEGLHDDVFDIISTSSAGSTSLPGIGLGEYRHVFRAGGRGKVKGRRRRRRRRSQTLSSSAHQAQSDTVGAKHDVQASGLRRSTRSSAPATRPRLPSPDAWSKLHPDWEKSWLAPLIFPETGKNRATVDKIDIPRLNESEFLNDNLVNFYIRHLQFRLEKERPELLRKVYFFSTFFFEKLKSSSGKINYDGVKAWTARVDLLSFDYIFVPVNEYHHWYLAIICNVPNAVPNAVRAPSPEEKDLKSADGSVDNAMEMIDAPKSPRLATVERDLTDVSLEDVEAAAQKDADGFVPSPRIDTTSAPPSPHRKRKFAGSTPSKFDPTQPRIITLDSLGSRHAPTVKALKKYLVEEAKAKKGIALKTVPTGMTAQDIPEQTNSCDCGVFVLGYMEEFLTNPDEAARKLFLKEELGWNIRPSGLRNHIRELLFELQAEQQTRHLKQREEKKLLKAKRKAMTE
ncbi:hypothetical protein TGAMA5MH_00375 [Trichoderma gamsii]|uniref:Ubiquitin-like protease family profile domain-containing protein n=1 Tax=Trichoderma gamsii TaxID=398673 RepID=A0A2K0TSJ7_9HYPO|nr:hypothetical protein TGAMA5MH_00375 [Trichoderma gamsii]